MSAASFLNEFFRNWQTVGAVAPSSPALTEQMMLAAEVGKARHILELGPGTGAFTEAIQSAMPKDASYLGIEINQAFTEQLRQRFCGMNFEVAGAQEFDFDDYLAGKPPIDVVVSGLPWTAFPRSLQESILGNVLPHLSNGGRFATFAYYGFHFLPSGQRFRELLQESLPEVDTSPVVWANLPPAFVYIGRK
ncbi:MAG: methyltransferase domain-containing protein [Verrucomicrobiota bacterium]